MFTLIIPHFLRHEDEALPPLNTPIFNQMRRNASFQAAFQSTAQLYQNHLCDQLALPPHAVYASPISQQIGMNHISAQHGTPLAISADEAQTWCDGLNQFYGDDAHFRVIRPDLWRIDFAQDIDWQTENIFNLPNLLPSDTAPAACLQISTEIQMWLHAHALNQNRTPCPINSVWLWQMRHETTSPIPYAAIATDSVWTSHSSQNCQNMPNSWESWQQYCQKTHCHTSDSAYFLENFFVATNTWDYVQAIEQFEQKILSSLQQAFYSGSLKAFKIICEQGELIIRKPSPLAFWKRSPVFDGKHL